mgnify:CR=1 FL=1
MKTLRTLTFTVAMLVTAAGGAGRGEDPRGRVLAGWNAAAGLPRLGRRVKTKRPGVLVVHEWWGH